MHPSLWDFNKILPINFIYETILMKISMIVNIMKTQIFQNMRYDLKARLLKLRSPKVTFLTNLYMNANQLRTQIFQSLYTHFMKIGKIFH